MKNIEDVFIPHYHYERADKISIHDIMSWGVKAVAVDIDNTICYDGTARFIGDCEKWISDIKQSGLPVVILSNALTARAKRVAGKVNIPYVANANKPKTDGFFKVAEMFNLDVSEIAFIGDQVFADVQGANTAGGVSVLVDPAKTEIALYFFYKYRRHKEKPVRKLMREMESKSGVPHKVKDFEIKKVNEHEHR